MRRYYFDVIDEHGVAVDDEGLVLRDIEAAEQEAARSMADAARDEVLRQSAGAPTQMSIQVRDDDGPVMLVKFSFEIEKRPNLGAGISCIGRNQRGV
jgi:uncharacterized protein DUF6894